MLRKDSVIVFQGDSITDMGRQRDLPEGTPNYKLGGGYPTMVAGDLLSRYPEDHLRFFNRAVSGDRVSDILARWKTDCINLEPNVVSLLCGGNDTFQEHASRNGINLSYGEKAYRLLVEYTLESLPGVQMILGEPFVFAYGKTPEMTTVHALYISEVRQRAAYIRKIAKDYDLLFVPYWEMFDKLLSAQPVSYWSYDGIHPTVAGQRKMADLWISVVEGK